jgi:hypothetical protein
MIGSILNYTLVQPFHRVLYSGLCFEHSGLLDWKSQIMSSKCNHCYKTQALEDRISYPSTGIDKPKKCSRSSKTGMITE